MIRNYFESLPSHQKASQLLKSKHPEKALEMINQLISPIEPIQLKDFPKDMFYNPLAKELAKINTDLYDLRIDIYLALNMTQEALDDLELLIEKISQLDSDSPQNKTMMEKYLDKQKEIMSIREVLSPSNL